MSDLEKLKKDFNEFFEENKTRLYEHKFIFDKLAKFKERLNRLSVNGYNKAKVIEGVDKDEEVYQCGDCLCFIDITDEYCRVCGAKLNWVKRKEQENE